MNSPLPVTSSLLQLWLSSTVIKAAFPYKRTTKIVFLAQPSGNTIRCYQRFPVEPKENRPHRGRIAMMKRPTYYGLKKRSSHLKNIEVWRELSGRRMLSLKEQYWTLADPNSIEFDSVRSIGLLQRPNQYHGVNNDHSKILELRDKHSGLNEKNFHHGDWCLVVENERPCPCGGLVYIDSMNQPDQVRAKASTMLAAAMRSCGPNTLICMNVCGVNPYKGHKDLSFDAFWANVHEQLPISVERLWSPVIDKNSDIDFLSPKTNATQMCCLFFWRAK